jgi:hypothetical protein
MAQMDNMFVETGSYARLAAKIEEAEEAIQSIHSEIINTEAVRDDELYDEVEPSQPIEEEIDRVLASDPMDGTQ